MGWLIIRAVLALTFAVLGVAKLAPPEDGPRPGWALRGERTGAELQGL